jgi:hypothetical protein
MLVDGLLSASAVAPSDVIISTRTTTKLDSLARQWPGIAVTGDNRLAACETRILFICVKPLDALPVLLDLIPVVSLETHIVSIAAYVHFLSGCSSNPVFAERLARWRNEQPSFAQRRELDRLEGQLDRRRAVQRLVSRMVILNLFHNPALPELWRPDLLWGRASG